MFCRPEKLPYLAGLPAPVQYQVLLKVHGMQPHGCDSIGGPSVLKERLIAVEGFKQTIIDIRGHLVGPLELTVDYFSDVIKTWYANGIPSNEFARKAKVAAWLFDLVIPDYVSPSPCNEGSQV